MKRETKATGGIKVKGLRKSFGKVKVLSGVSFDVKSGTILALLGPNGAGKTTTINILSTLLIPDGGTASVAGYDIKKDADDVRRSVGLTGQFAAVDEYLTGRENLEMIGKLYHMTDGIKERSQQLLEQFDLTDAAERPVRTYSGGMKRRLDLAMSLIASPPILFLDEPTTGLDPRSRLGLWTMIKQLAKEGKTILLTTQYMEEAEQLAQDVVVIDHGRVIASGTPTTLKRKVGAERVEIVLYKLADVTKTAGLFDKRLVTVDEENRTVNITAKQGASSLKDAINAVEKAKLSVASIALRQPTLDDVFLTLTGHEAESKEANHG